MRIFRLLSVVALCLVTAATLLCTFERELDEPLTMSRVDALGDTVSVFPTLRFAFSVPLENEEVSLNLEPGAGEYYSALNETGDTVDLIVTGMLEGNTTYVVSPAEIVAATTGSTIRPGSVTFSFVTHSREQEPNDWRDTTARFVDPIYGNIHTAQDTDYFFINTTSVSGLHLRSHDEGVALGLGLVDSSGLDTAVAGDEPEKYLAVPDSLVLPFFVRVYTLNVGGRYELKAYQP